LTVRRKVSLRLTGFLSDPGFRFLYRGFGAFTGRRDLRGLVVAPLAPDFFLFAIEVVARSSDLLLVSGSLRLRTI